MNPGVLRGGIGGDVLVALLGYEEKGAGAKAGEDCRPRC